MLCIKEADWQQHKLQLSEMAPVCLVAAGPVGGWCYIKSFWELMSLNSMHNTKQEKKYWQKDYVVAFVEYNIQHLYT